MGLTRLLQAPHGGRPLFGAQFRPSCQPSGRPAWVQRRKGRAACFETQPSHSPPERESKFVHLDVAAPAALSLIASVSNRASYHYCRPPREGGDEETLFGGIPLRPAREAHDATGKITDETILIRPHQHDQRSGQTENSPHLEKGPVIRAAAYEFSTRGSE